MLNSLLSHLIALVVGGAGGYYLHYRYGSSVKNYVAEVETRIQGESKKP